LAEELVGVLVGIVKAREERKKGRYRTRRGEWTLASGRGVAEVEGAV
jgi:hypothetical protein